MRVRVVEAIRNFVSDVSRRTDLRGRVQRAKILLLICRDVRRGHRDTYFDCGANLLGVE